MKACRKRPLNEMNVKAEIYNNVILSEANELMNKFLIILTLLLALLTTNAGAARREPSDYEKEIKKKSYSQWQAEQKKFWGNIFPYFHPTSEQIRQELKSDSRWAPYLELEESKGGAGPGVQTLNIPGPPWEVIQEGQPTTKPSTFPKGSFGAVELPAGVTLPARQPAAGQPPPVAPLEAPGTPAPEEKAIAPSSMGAGMRPPVPVPETPLIPGISPVRDTASAAVFEGTWIGRYQKLIEYFDPNTNQWNISENSLKDVPVELEMHKEGVLTYKMPQKEGQAEYRVSGDSLSIICEDVRVRGDYAVRREAEKRLILSTTRELVPDKMRVSLEFSLKPKQ